LPPRKTHLALDKLLLDKAYEKIHETKDKPSRWMGSKHRRALHDPLSNLILALIEYPKDPASAFFSAQLHDLVDFGLSKAKKRRTRMRL
jgi:hypothetical protein